VTAPSAPLLEMMPKRFRVLLPFAILVFAGTSFAAQPAEVNLLVSAARAQVGVTVRYDPKYRKIAFPLGDVPRDRGVCTDVIVRALRDGFGFDLQAEVNRDMTQNWDAYPISWKWMQFRPDPNIDHRRVPNLMKYFERRGFAVRISDIAGDYQPGDVVAWDLNGSQLHIGIVSEARSSGGLPMVIHNIGNGVREEDILFRFRIIGHYRVTGIAALRRRAAG
jgi:uncharacterized protein